MVALHKQIIQIKCINVKKNYKIFAHSIYFKVGFLPLPPLLTCFGREARDDRLLQDLDPDKTNIILTLTSSLLLELNSRQNPL